MQGAHTSASTEPTTDAQLRAVPLAAIRLAAANPRSDGAAGLAGLAQSLAHGLAQPPTLIEVAPGAYEVLTGERRVRAAQAAGWPAITALVEAPLDPLAAHTRRLIENLHRRDLGPLDEARALKLGWLCANATALGLAAAAQAALAAGNTQSAVEALGTELTLAGWAASRPAVTQQAYLAGLGLGMSTAALRKKLQVLNLAPEAEARLGTLGLTEAGMRAFMRLEAAQQAGLLAAIDAAPWLARRVKHIVQDVTKRGYPLEQALALARGEVWAAPPAAQAAAPPSLAAGDAAQAARLSQAALDLLAHAEAAQQAAQLLATHAAALPPPGDELLAAARALLEEALGCLG